MSRFGERRGWWNDRARGRAATVALLSVAAIASSRATTVDGAQIWGLDEVYTGIGYNPTFPTQSCGPSKAANAFREPGCTPYVKATDSYGVAGDPGFSPAKWAYKGKSFGPPYNNVDGMADCTYSLTYAEATKLGLERCFYAPDTGGVRTTALQKATANLGWSTMGWKLPPGEWRDKLPDYVVSAYEIPPLRLGFEEGTFFPNWKLLSSGVPNFAVVKTCFLEAHSGDYQLCSGYPTSKREQTHGVLQVQSMSFSLGKGVLMFEGNGGNANVADIPQNPYELSSQGKGAMGVSLTRISDGYRVLTKSIRARTFWETYQWSAEELMPYYGEVFKLEIFDYRDGAFGWIAVDSFVIPQAPVIITQVTPTFGPRTGGTRITITGENFGSSVEDKLAFIGDNECYDLRMSYAHCATDNIACVGALSCTVPAGTGAGVTVAVVIGDPAVVRAAGPRGGFQAGFCGDESTEHPFSSCIVADVNQVTGFRKRGFSYFDPPYVTSTPITLATQDALYEYRITAADLDTDDVLVYSKVTLPVFLKFDPTTQLLTGTPLRSDVQCRSDKWEPAAERCALGATYDVELQVTDSLYTVSHSFQLTVRANETVRVTDNSFHWENAVQIYEKYRKAIDLNSHFYIADAMARRNVSTIITAIVGFNYRNNLNERDATIRDALIAIASAQQVDEVQVNAALSYLKANGLEDVNSDMIHALKEQVEMYKRQLAPRGAASPALQGVHWKGWENYLKQLGASQSAGTKVYTNIDSLRPPPSASHMLLLEKAVVFQLATPCRTANSTLASAHIVLCDFIGISGVHDIWLAFDDAGASLKDIVVTPDDFEHTDLIQTALYTQDIPGLVNGLSRRLVSQSAKLQQISDLDQRYAAWYDSSSSILMVNVTLKGNSTYVVLKLDSSYPFPEAGSYGLPNVTVVRCDLLSYDVENALAQLSDDITVHGGNLTSRIILLETELLKYASRCKNLCNNHGLCYDDFIPPVCQCNEGYDGDDCSLVMCPNDCSGNGACDSVETCVYNSETGETDCAGGTGKCSCYYPYFGKDCSLKSCPRNYIVFEGNATHPLDITRGTQPIKDKYAALGLDVYKVQLSASNGDMPPPWAIAGDETSQADLVGAAYVVFSSSEDGQKARAQEPFYRDSIPSRGKPLQAIYFAQEFRNFIRREEQLLNLFGKSSTECNAAGSCALETGECDCATQYHGKGCEFSYCAKDCSGHGTCDDLSGTCVCDKHYVTDVIYGCALENLNLISTTCADEALDEALDDQGRYRRVPLHSSCLFGTKLGSLVSAVPTSFVRDIKGNVCADCSGYSQQYNKNIYFYENEPCQNPKLCELSTTSYDHVVRGIGMIPDPTTGSSLTFDLAAMRTKLIVFSNFTARPGIVREFLGEILDGGCGACTMDNPQCGASFTIALDGVPVWSSAIFNELKEGISIDVSVARSLTLSTSTYRGTYWRSNVAAGTNNQDKPAVWCDGAAWADAEFT